MERFGSKRIAERYPNINHVLLASKIIPIVAKIKPTIKARPDPDTMASMVMMITANQMIDVIFFRLVQIHEILRI